MKTRLTKWDRPTILRAIRKAHRDGLDLSYNATARRNQALISACSYHYKGYRNAVEMAGFNYAQIQRKPWWTPAWVVRMIKQARRAGEDLSWRVVSHRRDPLGHAAIAAVRPRLFGSWDKALEAAGIDPTRIRKYNDWTVSRCITELKSRDASGLPVNSGAIQREVPGLYGAITREFGRFDEALFRAGIEPSRVRKRRAWSHDEILHQLRSFRTRHGAVTTTLLRKHDYSLQKATVAQFRTLDAAVKLLDTHKTGAITARKSVALKPTPLNTVQRKSTRKGVSDIARPGRQEPHHGNGVDKASHVNTPSRLVRSGGATGPATSPVGPQSASRRSGHRARAHKNT